MAEKLYIIDGHAQIYRAYYAPFGDLTSPTGEPTRATHVFTSMLLKFLADKKPKYLAMAVDGPTAALERTAVYPQYKQTRAAMPDDLPPQIDRILKIVRMMGIPVLAVPGQEADDVIATLAGRFAGEDLDVVVISRDKDLDQVVGPHVVLYDPMKNETLDAAAIIAQKGYSPEQAVEVQTLMGDSIDNIPGIPGVGPKTAAKLILKYGTADNVVAHADEQTPKLRENLLAHAANLPLARKLVTLRRDVPVNVTLEELALRPIPAEALRAEFRDLGFHRMFDQLEQVERAGLAAGTPGAAPAQAPAAAAPPPRAARPVRKPPPIPGGLFNQRDEEVAAEHAAEQAGLAPPELAEAISTAPPEAAAGPEMPAFAPDGRKITTAADFDYRLIDTPEAVEALAKELQSVTRLSVDTETTSTQPMWCEVVGISLAWKAGSAVYIPLKGPMGSRVVDADTVRRLIGPVLADEKVLKIGQNIKYDLISLSRARMELRGKFFDTMVAAHVLDSTRMSYKLSELAYEFLAHRMIPIEDLIGRGKKQITMDLVPTGTVAVYSGEDADIALRLAELFEGKLAEAGLTGLFENLEMPLLPVLGEMEMTGIIVDPAVLKRMETELSLQADKLRDSIILAAGRPFNPDSPKQLAEVLFTDLKLPVQRSSKTGPSTDSEVLEQLAIMHELPGLVLDYRKLTKLIGTYLKSLAECIHPQTHRVHTDFHQAGTATGRLSSSDPNLQNIPIRTAEGKKIRSGFVADDGHVLLSADYSQVELRVLAHLCEDPTLIAAFAADQDIHRTVAAEVFGVAVADVTPEMRAKAKTVNFGIIYGQTAFGLALSLRISRTEAREFIDKYHARFPRIQEFLQACIKQANDRGYVETIFGRRRRIAEINSRNPQRKALAERLAINSVVQGSAADLIKQAMLNIATRIRDERRPSKMLLQIHDELVFEIPEKVIEDEREMVIREMSSAIQLRVPVKVETGAGKNWMDAK